MNITKILEFLNHIPGSTEVTIDRYSRLSTKKFNSEEEAAKVHCISIDQFQKIIRSWKLFDNLDRKIQAALIEDLENLKFKHMPLTADKIRGIYREVIEGNYQTFDPLSKIRWVSTKGSLKDRIVIKKTADELDVKIENVWFETWREAKLEENQDSIEFFRKALNHRWGVGRVNRALSRCGLDFDKMIGEGKALCVADARLVTMSLLDLQMSDLQETYDRLLNFAHGNGQLTDIERERLKRTLYLEDDAKLARALKKKFRSQKKPLEELDQTQFSFLTSIAKPSEDEIISSFFGQPIEGVISGHQDEDYFRFWFSYSKDLQERLQLNEKILHLHEKVGEKQLEQAYDEILAKALAKKSLQEGMLIPAPDGQWYQVAKRIVTGRGKLAYYLKPAGKHSDLPDRLVYRSTAMNPSHLDSFTTVVTDANPLEPPGYLWKKAGFKEELDVIFGSDRELKVIGHSLGSSYAQILMVNLLEEDLSLGDKKISLVCFDSPAISKTDAKKFEKWAKTSPEAKNIAINYYFSRSDIVPGAGDRHLGYGTHGTPVKVTYHMLDALDKDLAELRINTHGRFYFLTRPNIDFSMETGDARDLDRFDDQMWRKTIELGRAAAGTLVTPLVAIPGFLKRYFIKNSREDPQPLILGLNKKSQNPTMATS